MKKAISVLLSVIFILSVFACAFSSFAASSYCDLYGHRYSDKQVITAATCVGYGTYKRVCEYCNDIQVYTTTEKDPNNHTKLSPGISNSDGTHTLTCEDCHVALVKNCVFNEGVADGSGHHTKTCYYCNYTTSEDCTLVCSADDAIGKHTMTCSTCGYAVAENCSYTVEVNVAATCTSDGYAGVKCSKCNDLQVLEMYDALGHTDANLDLVCDSCGASLGPVVPVVEPDPCTCICHSEGFLSYIYPFVRFFWSLFNTNKTCACGVAHY